MKQYLKTITILFIIIGCNSVNKDQNNGFSLKGKTNGLNDETVILLVDFLSNKAIDSTMIKNNEFEFGGKLKNSPAQMIVQTKDLSQYKYFWLENKPMVFDASKSEFRNSRITGSKIQDLADQLYNNMDTIQDFNKVQEIEMKFVEENPQSIISASILSFYSTTWGKLKVEGLYNRFTDENKTNAYGKKIKRFLELNKNPQIGEKYVDFEMKNESGTNVRLSENLGKLTLLEFWASSCGPCRAENPNLVNTYSDFNPKGFEIFAVSLDDNNENWEKAIKEDKLTWTHVSDLEGQSNKAGLIYGINGIPDNFLLDDKGEIIGRNLRGERLNEKLKEYLK